jgi:hypothetical protein
MREYQQGECMWDRRKSGKRCLGGEGRNFKLERCIMKYSRIIEFSNVELTGDLGKRSFGKRFN